MLCSQITYQEALAAVFIEGWIFIAISLTGVRGRLVSLVPKSIMLATAGRWSSVQARHGVTTQCSICLTCSTGRLVGCSLQQACRACMLSAS